MPRYRAGRVWCTSDSTVRYWDRKEGIGLTGNYRRQKSCDNWEFDCVASVVQQDRRIWKMLNIVLLQSNYNVNVCSLVMSDFPSCSLIGDSIKHVNLQD